MVTVEQYEAYR